VGENGPVILPKLRLFRPFRDLLHAANVRHRANGFTSLPKDFIARKIGRLWLGANPRFWVPEARMLTTSPPKPLTFLCGWVNWVIRE
jgi:hypothetical protein